MPRHEREHEERKPPEKKQPEKPGPKAPEEPGVYLINRSVNHLVSRYAGTSVKVPPLSVMRLRDVYEKPKLMHTAKEVGQKCADDLGRHGVELVVVKERKKKGA